MIILAAKHNNRSSSLCVIQIEDLIIRTKTMKETDIIKIHETEQVKYPRKLPSAESCSKKGHF